MLLNPKLLESNYYTRRERLKMFIEIEHPTYGPVKCVFYMKYKEVDSIHLSLSTAFVEGMMIPLEEHQALLIELRKDEELFLKVKLMGEEIISREPLIIEENKMKDAGSLGDLTLDYLILLRATSVYSKVVDRKGTKLGDITEKEAQEHKLIVLVKFKELEDEYEFKVTYNKKIGYKVKVANKQKKANKLNIKDYLDENACKGIIMSIRRKVDYLP